MQPLEVFGHQKINQLLFVKMKKIVPAIEALLLAMVLLSCTDQKDTVPLPVLDNPVVNVGETSYSLLENNVKGIIVPIKLSNPAIEDSEIILQQTGGSPESNTFTALPILDEHQQIKIPVRKGMLVANLKFFPINDDVINVPEHRKFTFEIIETTSKLIKGDRLIFELEIVDDELVGKLKSFENLGQWKSKKTFEYTYFGEIKRIFWQTETPDKLIGSETYNYDDSKKLIAKNELPSNTTYIYTYAQDKIVKTEKVRGGNLLSYRLFDYDSQGHLQEEIFYDRDVHGELVLRSKNHFTYLENGNVHTISLEIPAEASNWELLTKFTFENYIDKINPVPYFEVVPGFNIQPNLPGKLTIEEQNSTQVYTFQYNFNNAGKVISRNLIGAIGSEISHYSYY